MHICCSNCAVYPVSTLKDRGITITGFWFNPNIHPFTEYKARLDSVKLLEQLWSMELQYKDEYGLTGFVRNVAGKESGRCEYCYSVRLEETAKKAKELNADAFTTSLLVSPYQKFDLLIETGRMLEDKYSVEFLDEDFRSGFRSGRSKAKELGFYSQKYCGCIYSEMERYLSGKQKKRK